MSPFVPAAFLPPDARGFFAGGGLTSLAPSLLPSAAFFVDFLCRFGAGCFVARAASSSSAFTAATTAFSSLE